MNRKYTIRYSVVGILFGFLFPIFSTIIEILTNNLGFSVDTILGLHKNSYLLMVIDTAPIFLGLFASLAGRHQDRLSLLNTELESQISSRNIAIDELNTLQQTLETQVENRTAALHRRSSDLQTAAEVARDASAARDLNTLLNNTVDLISQHFGFYHAGIFLLDEENEYAVLRAANSEGGKEMLTQGHMLRIGEIGIVGDTTETGRPHISLDVDMDAAHFSHPLLPDTRSEMAVPLMVGDTIIGALDVQSKEVSAFDEEDVTILQVLADLLAVAIRNSQLLDELQESVDEIQIAYGDFTRHSWREWTKGTYAGGYRFTGTQVETTEEQPKEVIQVWEKDQPIQSSSQSQSVLAIPIRLRNITLGVINVNYDGDFVPEDMVNLVNDIADRLALALENARLLASTQQRAAQEHLISGITSRMRETLDVDTVLKTAVQEIRGALELHDIVIQLEPPVERV